MMSQSKITNKFFSMASKAKFAVIKHSPEIFLAFGITGVIASTVMACIATTKLDETIKKPKKELEELHSPSKVWLDAYSKADKKKEVQKQTTRIYIMAGINIAELYLPAAIIGTLSLSSILASNNMLKRRNIALASAYAAIDKSFKDYRERVINRFGLDVDNQLRFDTTPVTVKEIVVDDEGNEKTVEKTVDKLSENGLADNDYARLFDETNSEWKPNADYNKMRLEAVESMLNDKLKVQGFLFLNDAYDALGFPRTKAGQIVGWKIDERSEYQGDNYIDLGLHDVTNPKVRDFLNGEENCIIINPNVDGDILTDFDV